MTVSIKSMRTIEQERHIALKRTNIENIRKQIEKLEDEGKRLVIECNLLEEAYPTQKRSWKA